MAVVFITGSSDGLGLMAARLLIGQGRPLPTRKRRIEAVSVQLLPARRSFWGERCAWMAATLKESAEDGDSTWSDFALVARDRLGKRPIDAIPLATRIASATVEAFEQR